MVKRTQFNVDGKMIKAEDIRKINKAQYRYLTKDEDGDIKAWSLKPVEDMTTWFSYRHKGCYNLGKIEVEEFQGKDWEDCLIEFKPNYSDKIGNENTKTFKEFLDISGLSHLLDKQVLFFDQDIRYEYSYNSRIQIGVRPAFEEYKIVLQDCYTLTIKNEY